jgi:hypothetical protein
MNRESVREREKRAKLRELFENRRKNERIRRECYSNKMRES